MSYTTWTVAEKDAQGPDGKVAIRVDLSGGTDPVKRIAYVIDGSTSIQALKAFVWKQSNEAASKSIADLITVGMTGSVGKPVDPAPPAPSAQDVFNAKVIRYNAGKTLGLTNPTAVADLNALFADINATYQSSFL